MENFKSLYQYLESLKNKKSRQFAFLGEVIEKFFSLQHEVSVAVQKGLSSVFPCEPSSSDSSNSFLSYLGHFGLHNDIWDAIYKYNVSLGVTSANTDPDTSKFNEEYSIKNYCNKALSELFIYTQTKTHILYLDMFGSDKHRGLLEKAVCNIVEEACFRHVMKTKNHLHLIINYTSFCNSLGRVAFETYCVLNPSLHCFIEDFNMGRTSYKHVLSLSFKKQTLLDNIYKALLSDDDNAFNLICSDAFNISMESSKILNLLKIVFSYYLFIAWQKQGIINVVTHKQAQDYFKDTRKRNNIQKNYKKAMIALGNCISEQLIECGFFKLNKASKRGEGYKLSIEDNRILVNLFNKAHYVKPILTTFNMKNMNQQNKIEKDDNYTMLLNQHYNKVRDNKNISINVKNPDTLYNLGYTKYSIDRKYLVFLLQFLEKLSINMDQQDIAIYFHLFNIDIAGVSNISTETAFVCDLHDIIMLSLDMNDHMYTDFYVRFKAKPLYPFKDVLEKLFLDMRTQKLFFINFLKESIFLSQFKYFMHTSYIDARGRIYTQAVYTNVHNYKLSKMLIKLYKPHSDKEESILEAVLESIKSADIKKRLEDYIKDNSDLAQLTQDLFIEDIRKYLNNVSVEEIKEVMSSDQAAGTLYLVENSVKDKNLVFFVHSMMCHLSDIFNNKADPHIALWYGQDAKCSGLQMLSILFRSQHLGTLCNLMGEDKIDIYTYSVDYFTKLRNNLRNHYVNCCQYFSNPDALHDILNKLRPNMPFSFAESRDLCIKLKSAIPLLNDMDSESIDWLFDIISEKTYTITSANILSSSDQELAPYFKLIVVLQKAMLLEKLTVEFPDLDKILKNRRLFKHSVMTYFYNATAYGRHQNFRDFLLSFMSLKTLKENDIQFLCSLFEKAFQAFLKEEIPEGSVLNDLTKLLAKKAKKVIVNNDFFILGFYPEKHDAYKMQTTNYTQNRGKQLILNIPNGDFDIIEFMKSFPANFIHSMDATIVHLFIKLMIEINKKLANNINYTYNHDNFMITHPIYLKYILMDCYTELYNSNYLTKITNLTEEEIEEFLPSANMNLGFKINTNFVA